RVILGCLEYQDTVAFSGRTERDDPQRRYAAARVSHGLTCGVVVECGISDLNHQEGIRAGRQRAFVIVRAGLQEHKIRLRLRRGTEHERILDRDQRAPPHHACNTRVSRLTLATCRRPTGFIWRISPSSNSRRSSSSNTPASAIRWNCSTVNRLAATSVTIADCARF